MLHPGGEQAICTSILCTKSLYIHCNKTIVFTYKDPLLLRVVNIPSLLMQHHAFPIIHQTGSEAVQPCQRKLNKHFAIPPYCTLGYMH